MGGWEDFVEFCACNWHDHGGWFFEFWKVEPCCGSPANLGDACKCVVCFTCCSLCSCSKLYATSVDQDCAFVNHCLPMMISPCAMCCMRHNFRMKNQIGPQDASGWVGDCFFGWIMPCFMGCQILRASEDSAYDWLGQFQRTGFLCCVNPCKPVYDRDQLMEMPDKDLNQVVKDVGDVADGAAKKLGSNK